MSDNIENLTVENEEEVSKTSKKKIKVGIKHKDFYFGRTNGVAHRKNRAKKKAQYLKNKAIRADLHAGKGNMAAGEYHSTLKALSMGTA